MAGEIQNLRIRFFGIQGSASTFPSREELEQYHEHRDYGLLTAMLKDLDNHRGPDGRLRFTPEEVVGGPRADGSYTY